ncbi:sigma-54-dependent Fis family transcriptional regulator [Pseudomonas aeruginosa]|uniref:sigma-54-dependent Fis family transcriptional regulator n=1 Tax=Pseudomonadaceae TaxID=135621 RepID=UPI001C948AE0|nr:MULTISPECIES: sigma-54-dependent Fis family transcriptional regulator [Pseudomonas aeruginosa group]MCV0060108.1 sigma-54-dependent Fis family transcriptional regulator [Pseudomonas aeruginosa]MCV0270885.1 sigma-54-dependent Fis family transcriptional regulator [Pseudomonas aeruginosa]MDI2561825.1 sigma-54-dependent Fis family transcriptional regulator [Pseudomonas aeruginosa]MDI3609768.1 sigma-54-dependent Fis family transcriptional regulator [Pseudomonas aeruginosa]MDI3668034.1 sigma-54-d
MHRPSDPAATPTPRKRFVDSQVVARSWQRSQNYGLSQRDNVLFDAPVVATGKQIAESNRLLLDCATPEMRQLHASLAPQDWVLACLDMEGVVLSSLSGRSPGTQGLNRVFRVGAQLTEQNVGTTAPGCAMAERDSVFFIGEEHYLEAARQFSCLAAPIFGLDGGIVGVLDASSQHGTPSVYTLESLVFAARAIENRMFAQLGDVLLVHLHHRLDILGTPLEGLLAFDPAGKLRYANRIAGQLLRLGEVQAGLDFADLFDMPFAHAACYRRHDLSAPLRLRSHHGGELHACLTLAPSQRSTPAPQRQTAALPVRTAKSPAISDTGPCLQDPALQDALARARKAFARDIPVLINGETGTGKEVFARLLHEGSARAGEAFVAINCSSIPASLIESELFGHVEGAFTGSRKGGAIGKVEQAHKGTLFLDEVGDMPLELQGRLLRVLQERSLSRLGSNQLIKVDCALICATHRDLQQLSAEQGFREDLYYRINGLRVSLPALRERRDLGALIQHLLRAETTGQQSLQLSPAALQALLDYHWPGNIRQLYQCLRLAAALAEDDGEIGVQHLPDEVRAGCGEQAATVAGEGLTLEAGSTLQLAEARAIRAAVEAAGGNLSAAARSLGIARATLYRKLKGMEEG